MDRLEIDKLEPKFIEYMATQGWRIPHTLTIENEDGSQATGKAMEYVINCLDEEWCHYINSIREAELPEEVLEPMRTEGDFVKYEILVRSEEDKKELQLAFRHIHDSDIDTQYLVVNQLAHEYEDDNSIVVLFK